MFDNGRWTAHYQSKEELTKALTNSNDIRYCETKQHTHTGQHFDIFDLRNLKIIAHQNEAKLSINNSLTTFLKGNNHQNISLPDLVFIRNYLSETLSVRPEKLIPNSLEFAVNVETPLPPFDYFSRFQSLRLNPFYYLKPPPGSKPLERYCTFQQYTVKCYDTAKWHGLTGRNLLKFETVFHRMEKIKAITKNEVLNFEVLTRPEVLNALCGFVTLTYREIDKQLSMDAKQFSPEEIDLLFAGSLPGYWKAQRQRNRNTAKRRRRIYRELKRETEQSHNELFKDLDRRLTEEFESLINTPFNTI